MTKRKKLMIVFLGIVLMLLGDALLAPVPASAEVATYPQPYYEYAPYMHGPYVDRVVFLFMSETMTIWEAFKRGELDVSGQIAGIIPAKDVQAFGDANPTTVKLYRETTTTYGCHLGFNVLRWPTSELAVRRAIAHLIDWEYHATTTYKPGIVPETWGWGYGTFGYETWRNPKVNIQTRYPYSTELAKKELTDAGWTFTDNEWYSPNGTKMGELIYLCPGYSPERIEQGMKLAEDSAKIGIKWKVVSPPDWPSTERMSYMEREFNLFGNCATADTLNPPLWYFNAYHSSSWSPPGTTCVNHFGIKDPELDKLIEQLSATNDMNEAIRLTWQIQAYVEDKVYIMPMVAAYPVLMAVSTKRFSFPALFETIPKLTYEDPDLTHQSYFTMMNIKPQGAEFGGTYVANRMYWPTSWNPLNWMEGPELQIYKFLYLQLATRQVTPQGKDVLVPLLARDWKVETWEVTPGKLGNKFTVYLFNNITWHDGVPCTAEDVKYTLDLIAATKTTCAHYAPIWRIYVKSEVIDPYTVEIYTKETGAFQIYTVMNLITLPKHIFALQADAMKFENYPPIGNGPFMFEDMKSHEFVSIRANPRFYLPARRLVAAVTLAEKEKTVGDKAKFQFKLTGPLGEKVTNGTVALSLMKAGETVAGITATHIGEGVYEATVDTATIGTGDYIIKGLATYRTPAFTWQAPISTSLTVLPEVYKTLTQTTETLRAELNTAKDTITAHERTIASLQATVSGMSTTVTASIGVSVVSIIIAVVAVVLAVRKKPA